MDRIKNRGARRGGRVMQRTAPQNHNTTTTHGLTDIPEAAQCQESESHNRLRRDEVKPDTYEGVENKPSNPSRPLKAVHGHCLRCCNGSPHEVKLCAAK